MAEMFNYGGRMPSSPAPIRRSAFGGKRARAAAVGAKPRGSVYATALLVLIRARRESQHQPNPTG